MIHTTADVPPLLYFNSPLITASEDFRTQTAMPAIVPKHLGDDDDDWETDPDYVNTMSEEQQRWGGARDTGVLDMDKFREEIKQEHINETKKRQQEDGYKSSTG